MKKTLFILAFVAVASSAFAQVNMMNKRGESILPETGNYALGIDAWPFLQYAGQLLNATSGQSSVYFNSPVLDNNVVIYGKYVKDPTMHYRAKVRIGFGSEKWELPVTLDSANGNSFFPFQYGNDEYKWSGNGVHLGVGIEKRRGQGRLQGYYGPEICIGFSSMKETYSYANAMGEMNTTPTISSDWGSYSFPFPYMGNARVTERKFGSAFHFGLRAFAGVEYFFMTKASIGAEFGWGIMMTSHGAQEVSTERWGDTGVGEANALITETIDEVGKANSFGIDTDVDGGSRSMYGSIRMLMYF